jgi:aconitate hydratase
MSDSPFDTLQEFQPAPGRSARLYSLPQLRRAGIGNVARLPISLRVVLESLLRNCDGKKITEEHVRQLAGWQPVAPRSEEIPFVVARIVLQDFTGVPLLCDLAAMRSAVARCGKDPQVIEPLVPVHLVVDHSVQVDHYRAANALTDNMEIEFQRNAERYSFIKWGMQAFDTFKVVPPGIGIVHQVNLEYLASSVWSKDGVYYPDSLVGTDSHTTMINGIGVVGWGVGGIEAEAGMLGQPLYMLTPDVVGVNLHGRLSAGVTATDLVLTLTELLRKANVVGSFVEFHGAGAASLAVPDRATIGNMAPEYGATMGFFPVDEATLAYFRATGREEADIAAARAYFEAQEMFGMPAAGAIDYTRVLELDLASVKPSVAGPKRPQDRIEIGALPRTFDALLRKPVAENGYNKTAASIGKRFPCQPTLIGSDAGASATPAIDLGDGDVLIAAITSCTNTSNPSVMLAAGLLARQALARGLSVAPHVKTSLAPGSRVVTEYLKNAGLLPYLEQLGFSVVAYGCTTCIGNSGPLDSAIEDTLVNHDLVCAAVLSGNRNFEARIHPNIRANFLMSPPLVVAFAIAGRIGIDLEREPLGTGSDGQPVYLRDIWPDAAAVAQVMPYAVDPATYRERYGNLAAENPLWNDISATADSVYPWGASTYIAEPPFFADFDLQPHPSGDVRGARALALFGDSVTTDHISPAGSIKPSSPAGGYLQEQGVAVADFNSYGSRRGNHEVMIRGTFANVRIKNLMLPPGADGSRIEGGFTLFQPGGEQLSIFDAAERYQRDGTPTVIFAGEEYGTGSSRDWAAKGTLLLGVKAVIARSFERIHRSNLVGMGVLPLQFTGADDAAALGIRGDESFDLLGLDAGFTPKQAVTLVIRRADGSERRAALQLRIDTPIEADYFRHGGILPYVLRELMPA